ncbi:hypothetical protein ACIA8O_00765 [Kitasatospora sp. NPDC051853]|uniref:hypothetical protein n=1 Tax=Kitasatospora sp. NPDC051853 TaxID=3364058 RepID=UPI0037880F95
MNTTVERLRTLVAEVITWEEDWEADFRARLPSYNADRKDFPVAPDDEEDYYRLREDRDAAAFTQLRKTTAAIDALVRELTETAEADQPG